MTAQQDQPPSPGGSRLLVALGVALLLLVVSLGFLGHFWNRTAELEGRLAAAEQQVRDLDQRLLASEQEAATLRDEAQAARAQASQASEAVEREAEKRQQAELQREFARDENERSRLESERALAEAARNRAELERMRRAREEELDRMQKALSQIAETRRTREGMVMSLGEDQFLFEFDQAALGPKNRELLSRIAGVLLVSQGYRLYVYGHTDDVGSEQYNQQLSERRAYAVRGYLIEAGVPAEIIDAKGFGKSSPRAKGTSREARRENRRVEIGVVDTIINYGGQAADSPG